MEDEARKIIAQLAKDRRVEALVCNVARRHEPLGADLQDLCQMIYVFLLEYNPEKIVAMHQRGDLDFFLVRMIVNNLQSVNRKISSSIKSFEVLLFEHNYSISCSMNREI